MTDAVENSLATRGHLLRQELEVVKAALERKPWTRRAAATKQRRRHKKDMRRP